MKEPRDRKKIRVAVIIVTSNSYGLRDPTKLVIKGRCQEAESRVSFVGDFTDDDRAIFA
jgi:hypothetical protein